MKGREIEMARGRDRDLLSTDSFAIMAATVKSDQVKDRSKEIFPGLPHGFQEPKQEAHGSFTH